MSDERQLFICANYDASYWDDEPASWQECPRYGYCGQCGQIFPPKGETLPCATQAQAYDALLPAFSEHTCGPVSLWDMAAAAGMHAIHCRGDCKPGCIWCGDDPCCKRGHDESKCARLGDGMGGKKI